MSTLMADTQDMTTATKNDWTIDGLGDDAFEAFAAWMEAWTPARRMVSRDALGRFCRMVHEFEVVGWINAGGMSHAHDRCGTLVRDTRHGATPTMTVDADGFKCGACVAIDVVHAGADAHIPPRSGTIVCTTCDAEKSIKKFPTVWLHGFIADRGRQCRDCCQPWRNRPVAVGGGPVLVF